MTNPISGTQASTSAPDVVAVLIGQHARIKALFTTVRTAAGPARQDAFEELRELLAVHETAEEVVLRPVSQKAAGQAVTDARNAEEKEANAVLAKLEKLDVNGTEFEETFAQFEKAVLAHAEHEEQEEFPAVVAATSPAERQDMGKHLLRAEHLAPTHPHAAAAGSPAAQKVLGPFAAMVDRVRDTLHQ
jgi:hemerythrin superfamily protein